MNETNEIKQLVAEIERLEKSSKDLGNLAKFNDGKTLERINQRITENNKRINQLNEPVAEAVSEAITKVIEANPVDMLLPTVKIDIQTTIPATNTAKEVT